MLGRAFGSIRTFLRANFLAGLFVAIPFTITIVFLIWLWGRLQQPLERFFNLALTTGEDLPWSNIGLAIERSDARFLLIPMVSLALLLTAVLLLGIVARSIFGKIALTMLEGVVIRLPLVGMLYKSLKQLSEAVMGSDGKSKFQRAVAIQFPYRGVWAIGFVTGRGAGFMPSDPALFPEEARQYVLTVFVPTSPLPTQGFMVVVPEHETIDLNIPVPDALKLVVSGGMIDDATRSQRTTKVSQAINQALEAQKSESAARPGIENA